MVIISGYAEFSYALEAVQKHAFDYLLKPIKVEDLERVLVNYLKESEETESKEGTPSPDRMIDNVIQEIRAHYTEDIQLTNLAAKYNIRTGRLCTMINEELEMNFS